MVIINRYLIQVGKGEILLLLGTRESKVSGIGKIINQKFIIDCRIKNPGFSLCLQFNAKPRKIREYTFVCINGFCKGE